MCRSPKTRCGGRSSSLVSLGKEASQSPGGVSSDRAGEYSWQNRCTVVDGRCALGLRNVSPPAAGLFTAWPPRSLWRGLCPESTWGP